MKYNEYTIMRHLKIPECGINFALFLLLHDYNLVLFIDLNKYITNCNMLFLDKFDTCENTRGKITFIPVDFLYYYYNNNRDLELHKNINICDIDSIYIKEYLYNFLVCDLKNKKISHYDFLKSNQYKGIDLFFFRKPFIRSDFSKNKDFSLIKDIKDDIFTYKNGFVNPALQINIDPQIRVSEWMSSYDISNIIYSLTKIHNDIYYIDLINFPIKHTDVGMVSSGFENYKTLTNLDKEFKQFKKSNKRYLLFTMLYDNHFTCLIYDSQLKIDDSNSNGICYLFNSGGYNPSLIKLDTSILFIDSNMAIKKFNSLNTNLSRTSHISHNNIDVIIRFMKKEFKTNIFILNTFTLQQYYSECGMFCTLFLYLFIVNKDRQKNANIKFIKKLYYTMSFFGDLLISYTRGLFYVNKDDCDELKYKNTLDVFKLKNKKITELKEIYVKNINRLINSANRYKNIKNKYYGEIN
jgi:hypothetical protein